MNLYYIVFHFLEGNTEQSTFPHPRSVPHNQCLADDEPKFYLLNTILRHAREPFFLSIRLLCTVASRKRIAEMQKKEASKLYLMNIAPGIYLCYALVD